MNPGRIVAFVVILAVLPAPLRAEEMKEGEADHDVQHQVSITISPVHLFLPVIELTGEYRVADKIGVSAILGAGRVETGGTTSGGSPENKFLVIEGGTQFRYYPVGTFVHGMQLGTEILFIYIDRDETDDISVSGEGLAIGPFIGYKVATDGGFTFDTQVGFEYVVARAHREESTTATAAEKSADTFIVLLNLNVGWSF